ncbi:MAG: exonuclease domain-containing protein [Campylobacterota bacterium]|nr:exonuclease domain-containing protein [Campylobacterota bacterium]
MLIFLDLETTGLQQNDKICSIGLIAVDDSEISVKYDLINEGKKIPSQTSSIHHITNEMIKGKPRFEDSETYKFLQLHNHEDSTLIAHNVRFDLNNLLACGFEWQGRVIDTLRVTKHLIPECERFSLQFLRYELKLYRVETQEALACGMNANIVSHNALDDALMVKLLYTYLLDISSYKEMIELSFKNVLLQKLEFGKHSGKYIEEVAMNDRGYLEWMLGNIMDLDDDLRYSITYYLQG